MTALIKAWAKFTIAGRIPIITGSVLLLIIVLLTGKTIPFDNSTERYLTIAPSAISSQAIQHYSNTIILSICLVTTNT